MAKREIVLDTAGFGLALWLAGYVSSILLYFFIPKELLGWVLFAVFAPITAYVAYWRFHSRGLGLNYFLAVAAAWTLIAVAFDYVFIVKMFSAADYYKTDVYLYYITTFLIPAGIGAKYSGKP
jgi:hypothetical protein